MHDEIRAELLRVLRKMIGPCYARFRKRKPCRPRVFNRRLIERWYT
jgi:hypothetical protein